MTVPNTNHYRLLILGSGPAGCTAAIYSGRANLHSALITGITPGGQLLTTERIDNWPGEEKGVSGPELMEKMLNQVKRYDVAVINDQITSVNLKVRPFVIQGAAQYSADALIIATGASARYLEIPSEKEFRGRGISACATCDGFFYRGKKVSVIGGGNSAVGEALYLAEIAAEVVLIHRRDQLTADPILTAALSAKEKSGKIKVEWNQKVIEILGDASGVTGVRVEDTKTGTGKVIELKGIFIAIGHTPNTELFRDQLMTDHDYLVVQKGEVDYKTATSIPGVFAAGDVADPIYRQAITAAGSGCMAAIDAKKYLNKP